MIELVKSEVVFNEEDHTYFLGEKELFGITGMISRHLFPGKYDKVPKYILEKARAKGSFIHAQCQFVDETGLSTDCIEAANYVKERIAAGYFPLANEYLVSDNENIATKIDNVWTKKKKIALCDIKTTYILDKEYLSWQLSVGAYLFELQNPLLKVDELFGIWLRNNKSELVPIERKPDDEVKKLIECELRGELYVYSALTPADAKSLIPLQLVDTIIEIEEQAAFMSELQKEYKEKLKVAMRENGVKSWDAGRMKVSYTPSSQGKSFDAKKFQEDHPELYAKYVKTTTKADSIRITIRE